MNATIWHNPGCSTSRKALDILLQADGVQVTVVQYLKTPPTRAKLAQLYADAGLTPREGLRTRNTPAAERGLTSADADTILDAMVAEPVLIERPLVETDKGVRLCRPLDKIHEIL